MSEAQCQEWHQRSNALAAEGLRVLALARKTVTTVETLPYQELVLLGLVGFEDPPRHDVRAAIEACRRAGLRVVMITGDQPITARHIAVAAGVVPTMQAEVIRFPGPGPWYGRR